MVWTLLAMLALVLTGGFISYYGDLQGRRWGKKRVSWFGMRPKHTAILITSLTGGFIALMSVVTVMLIAPRVREVVLRGERAIDENKGLNLRLKSEVFTYTEDSKRSLAEATANAAKLTGVHFRLTALNAQYQQELKKNKKIIDSNDQLILAKRQLLVNVASAQHDIHKLQIVRNSLQSAKTRLQSSNRDLGDQNWTYVGDNTKLQAANQELKNLNEQIRDTGIKLTKANEVLDRTNKIQLAANKIQLLEESRLKSEIGELQSTQEKLYQKQNDLYSQLASSGRDMQQTFMALRQLPLSVRAGEMLGRRVIAAHQRPEAIRKELMSLLEDASVAALIHGASKGENGRAVRIVSKHISTLTSEHDTDEQASLDAMVETLFGSDQPVVVVVNAINNSVEGEDVLIELSPRAVTPLFAKGDVIAKGKIDARQPTDKILNSIVEFLQNNVRNSAMHAGAVPLVDPDTGKPNYGFMSPSELLLLTDKVRRRGGDVEITALAKEAVSSADPIQLEFKLKRL